MTTTSQLIRRKELQQRLKGRGISRYEMEKLIATQTIQSRPLHPGGRKFFDWHEVKQTLGLT